MSHAMIDIETLGTKPGCVVLSIGAVLFDPFGKTVGMYPFYRNISKQSCVDIGLTEDPGTVKWWSEQSDEAKNHLLDHQVHIISAMSDLQVWCVENGVDRVWCQGATFDAPILQDVFERLDIQTPWHFSCVRDTRTVYDLFGLDQKTLPRVGIYHNALDDAIFQVIAVQTALKNGIKIHHE